MKCTRFSWRKLVVMELVCQILLKNQFSGSKKPQNSMKFRSKTKIFTKQVENLAFWDLTSGIDTVFQRDFHCDDRFWPNPDIWWVMKVRFFQKNHIFLHLLTVLPHYQGAGVWVAYREAAKTCFFKQRTSCVVQSPCGSFYFVGDP